MSSRTFVNPIYHGCDPWTIGPVNGYYYSCRVGIDGQIEVCKSLSLISQGVRSIVWQPPQHGWNSHEIWAPELHRFGDRWYIYYAASNGSNSNHRMGVLESLTDDPQGPFRDKGKLYTGDGINTPESHRWAIDGTVLKLNGQLYFIWSGWEDDRDIQHLYIALMSDPCTIASKRVRICDNDTYLWERVGEQINQRGLHEGPQILIRYGKVFLIYSCSGSWQTTYKLGMLYMGDTLDPMQPSNWKKHHSPVFNSTNEVFGVGHCCFVKSLDGVEDWIIYHSKTQVQSGWEREVSAQRFTWDAQGMPNFGTPLADGVVISMPSGE